MEISHRLDDSGTHNIRYWPLFHRDLYNGKPRLEWRGWGGAILGLLCPTFVPPPCLQNIHKYTKSFPVSLLGLLVSHITPICKIERLDYSKESNITKWRSDIPHLYEIATENMQSHRRGGRHAWRGSHRPKAAKGSVTCDFDLIWLGYPILVPSEIYWLVYGTYSIFKRRIKNGTVKLINEKMALFAQNGTWDMKRDTFKFLQVWGMGQFLLYRICQ